VGWEWSEDHNRVELLVWQSGKWAKVYNGLFLEIKNQFFQSFIHKCQIFYACHISATRILAPKSLKVVVNTNIFWLVN
jgi:hypothetical protein